jgi:hypothetical protein
VAASTVVTISAAYQETTRTASLTVVPPALSSLTLNPTSLIGGTGTSTGTLTLNGPAPSGGVTAMLATSDSAAWLDDHVTILAGATTATFTVNTAVVMRTRDVTVSASNNGVTRSAVLTVRSAVPGM